MQELTFDEVRMVLGREETGIEAKEEVTFQEGLRTKMIEKCGVMGVEFITNVTDWIERCIKAGFVPMFKTKYAKKPLDNCALGVCWGAKGTIPSQWFKEIPSEDRGSNWKLLLQKYGTEEQKKLALVPGAKKPGRKKFVPHLTSNSPLVLTPTLLEGKISGKEIGFTAFAGPVPVTVTVDLEEVKETLTEMGYPISKMSPKLIDNNIGAEAETLLMKLEAKKALRVKVSFCPVVRDNLDWFEKEGADFRVKDDFLQDFLMEISPEIEKVHGLGDEIYSEPLEVRTPVDYDSRDGYRFRVDDRVKIIGGIDRGKYGQIVSIINEDTYAVQIEAGEVRQMDVNLLRDSKKLDWIAPPKEVRHNKFVQFDKGELRNVVEVGIEDKELFYRDDPAIKKKIIVSTTVGDPDPDYLNWKAYIVDINGTEALIFVKEQDILVGRVHDIISPLFSQSEARVLLRWLDTVDTFALPSETIRKLKLLIDIWASDARTTQEGVQGKTPQEINAMIDAKLERSEHWQKYEYWAQKIGIPHLVDLVPFTKEQIIEALRTDEYLNNLPLKQWDAQDVHITRLARDRGFPAWSLANSVSLLKHVARYHIVSDIERPETVEVEREPYVPPEREEPYETIRECLEEAKADIMGRCANIPRHYLKDCIQVHEAALRDIEMLILNDQDLYDKGPYSRKWSKTRDDIIEYAYYWCENAFKPNAEEEIEELRKPTGDKAKDLANKLWIPYLEQFVEIPREERTTLTDECKRTVKFSIQDMETCLRDKWKKP